VSALKWERSGPTLAAEPTPVATSPDPSLLFGPVPRPPTGTEAMWIALLNGTSITVQLWAEISTGVWILVGAPITLAVHASAQVTVPSGVPLFAQVTAAAGAPSHLGAGTVYS
jgi:hypothetical protein